MKTLIRVGRAAVIMAVSMWGDLMQAEIPRLDWECRSDWINVKTSSPAALGDGMADDTTALQSALNRGVSGGTVYLPPGVYRITRTLVFPGGHTGAAIIGHGRDTRIIWDGVTAGCMFRSDGVAYCRYIGLSWDGRGRAAVGFDHAASKRFETEVLHQHESFRNFTDYGIRIGNQQKYASAEILYQNCFFENCETALGLLTFNDYNNTVDHCEFRECGTGVLSRKSNFYARNSHFERSRQADFMVGAEHGCSIRRCTSLGSRRFVLETDTIAPLTIQDCQVAGWTGPDAVQLNGSPALIFDSTFAPVLPKRWPIIVVNHSQQVLLSNNQPSRPEDLITGVRRENLHVIPAGNFKAQLVKADQHFLREYVESQVKVFDAVRDFGAKGDGKADDSSSIQAAIDASRRHGQRSLAYLPTGRYAVRKSLVLSGADFSFGGSGFNCGLIWRGPPGEPMIIVSGVSNVALSDFMIGSHDLGPMNHGEDILFKSPAGVPFQVVLDGIYAYGMYQKAPDIHGLHFKELPSGSSVDARHVQGNIRITGCGQANLLFRASYEGTVTIRGSTPADDEGFVGFLTRLSTISKPALQVFDNQSVVMSDFYNEQSDQVAVLSGSQGQAHGRVTLQAPKLHLNTTRPMFELNDYSGSVCCVQSQFYCDPRETEFLISGSRPLELVLAGNFWYRNQPFFKNSASAAIKLIGNSGPRPSSSPDLTALASALDDLRRLGQMDLQIGARQ